MALSDSMFRLQCSTSINALLKKIFPLLNDFMISAPGSPFEKLDPTMKRIYGAAASGLGLGTGGKVTGRVTWLGDRSSSSPLDRGQKKSFNTYSIELAMSLEGLDTQLFHPRRSQRRILHDLQPRN